MANAVIVVDMLRGFLEAGYPLYCGDRARGIIPEVEALLRREIEKGSKVFFVCDSHEPDDLEFKMFPPHCVRGTEEAQLIPDLGGYPGEVIEKNRYSGFHNTPLDEKLSAFGPEKLIICGVCTDICVLHTVADARNRDYPVAVPLNCVASSNDAGHEFALQHMEKVLGADLTRTE